MKMGALSRHARDLVVAFGIVLGAAACTWQGVKPSSAAPEHIYVRGKTPHVSDQKLAKLARPYLGDSFLDIDTGALRARLKTLPWLDHVSVSRRWPNGVLIRLSEHRAAAHWNKKHLLAADGTVFTPADVSDVNTPVALFGPATAGRRVYGVYRKLRPIADSHGARLVELRLLPGGEWRARLADGLNLRLGRTDLVARMRRFATYRNASKKARTTIARAGYVDLRYSDGFAVGGTRTPANPPSQEQS